MISYKVMIIQAQSNDDFFEKRYLGHFPKKLGYYRIPKNIIEHYVKALSKEPQQKLYFKQSCRDNCVISYT